MKKLNKIISAFCIVCFLCSATVHAVDLTVEGTEEMTSEEIASPEPEEENKELPFMAGAIGGVVAYGVIASLDDKEVVEEITSEEIASPEQEKDTEISEGGDFWVPKEDSDFNPPVEMTSTIHFQKQIINENNEPADQEDFKNLGLEMSNSFLFKIKLTNTETNETYNITMEKSERKNISKLKAGTYEIEEMGNIYFDFVEFVGQEVYKNNEKYYVDVDTSNRDIYVNVVNKINTDRYYVDIDEQINLLKKIF